MGGTARSRSGAVGDAGRYRETQGDTGRYRGDIEGDIGEIYADVGRYRGSRKGRRARGKTKRASPLRSPALRRGLGLG